MKNSIYFTLGVLIFFSCNNADSDKSAQQDTPESVWNSVIEMDDSLQTMINKRMTIDTFKIDKLVYHEAINRNKKFYSLYPTDEKAQEAVEKIASLYMQLGIEREAVKWRDSILLNYPKTKNKLGLLELQLSYYDFDNYTPEKITYYANELLSLDNLPEDKKEDYEFRLKHIDKTFEELIQIRIQEMDSLQSKKSPNT
jgi:outer membrane protein assembly factor BamD (BamD/ComL family)